MQSLVRRTLLVATADALRSLRNGLSVRFFSYYSDFKRLGAKSRWASNPGKFTNNAFCGGRVVRDVAGAASKHGLLLVDWWFGMQGFPRAFCGITANRGLFWGIGGLGCRESRGLVGFAFILAGWGGEFWHEVCVVVGVVVGQGLMSVFVGVFSMFSGCPPPISQETISNIA